MMPADPKPLRNDRGMGTGFLRTGNGGNLLRHCMRCNQHTHQTGGKPIGKLKLWNCGACVAAREAAK